MVTETKIRNKISRITYCGEKYVELKLGSIIEETHFINVKHNKDGFCMIKLDRKSWYIGRRVEHEGIFFERVK